MRRVLRSLRRAERPAPGFVAERDSRPMRVGFVVTSTARRGAELEAVALAGALRDHGIDAEVVALAPATSARTVPIEALGSAPLAPRTLLALRRWAAAFDVVVAFGSKSLPACALALGRSTPWIYRSVGDPAAWSRGRVHRARTGLLMRRATAVVALWPEATATLHRLYGISIERLDAIPNGRDPEVFAPLRSSDRLLARAATGLDAGVFVCAFVGALSPEKRPLLAVQAALAADADCVLVAGDGPQRPALERALAGAPVRFLGSVEDVRNVYAQADVVVLLSDTEGLPGVVIESLLCGTPVVATEVGAIAGICDPLLHTVPRDVTPDAAAAAISRAASGSARPDGGPLAGFAIDEVAQRWARTFRTVGR